MNFLYFLFGFVSWFLFRSINDYRIRKNYPERLFLVNEASKLGLRWHTTEYNSRIYLRTPGLAGFKPKISVSAARKAIMSYKANRYDSLMKEITRK